MSNKRTHMESTIKREISRIYKEELGKGPENTEIIIYENFVFMKFKGGLTHVEERLINTETGKDIVEKMRKEMILDRTYLYVPMLERTVCEKVEKINYMIDHECSTIYIFVLFSNMISYC